MTEMWEGLSHPIQIIEKIIFILDSQILSIENGGDSIDL